MLTRLFGVPRRQSWLAGAAVVFAVLTALAGMARAALPPPRNPAHALRLDEHVRTDCTGVHDVSATCIDESVAMLNAGRRNEGLGPLLLPRNWARLTVPEQIFVLTELERTARGLQPDTGLAADWNTAARAGADDGTDPTRAGSGAPGFLAIWAGGQQNPVIAMVGWIYDDAEFPDHTSQTINCSGVVASGCWGHRDAVLRDTAATACGRRCAVGAGYSPSGFAITGSGQNRESYAEVFGVDAANNPDPLMFRWTSELRQLPGCERVRDDCSWTDRPLVTAAGVINVRGIAQHTSLIAPWFSAPINWSAEGNGSLTVWLGVGTRINGLTVTATQGARQVALRVRRSSSIEFVATAELTPGHWALRVHYGTPAIDGPAPSATATVRVP
jgi:hypothetical protein